MGQFAFPHGRAHAVLWHTGSSLQILFYVHENARFPQEIGVELNMSSITSQTNVSMNLVDPEEYAVIRTNNFMLTQICFGVNLGFLVVHLMTLLCFEKVGLGFMLPYFAHSFTN